MEEKANLVEKDKTKNERILMMANEGITLDSDMVWYLDTSATNHMYGHKHLFLDILEIKDEHVSLQDSTKTPIKGRGKICFSHKDEKKVWRTSIMYMT